MNYRHATLVILFGVFSRMGLAQQPAVPSVGDGKPVATDVLEQTPAQLSVAAAKEQLKADPKKVQAWNELALSYLRRVRETEDDSYVKDADAALAEGLKLDSTDFQLLRTQVALMLQKHDWTQARDRAIALHRRTPDDVMTYGYIAEADIALGDNEDAVTNAQWMLNLRPRNIPGLLMGARLRVIYGNPHGAIDFLNLAYSETSPTEVEELAWIDNQIASIQLDSGEIAAAKQTLDNADQLFPKYPCTIRNMARLRTAQNPASVGSEQQASQSAPIAAVKTSTEAAPVSVLPSPPTQIATPVNVALTARIAAFAPVPETLLTPQPTPTEHVIHTAQAAAARNPQDASAYAQLGAAYFQHARETGDISDYQMAEESLTRSLNLVSADFSADSALETMAEVCMGEHRFSDALNYAQKALSLGTGDVSPFAIVGDAYADMGQYDKASTAYGRLTPRDMTLAPRAAYARDSRLSYLRFVAGDTAGAIALMKTAVTEGVEAQLPSENLAWLYYELGEYETQAGDAPAADAAYLTALITHPGDYRALAALGKLRANHGKYAEAIMLYQKAIAVVPMPTYIAELGDLYARSGNQAEAQKQFALVEYIGLLGHINQVLHNRDLALFYADHDIKLAESLDLARKELEVRRDVYTWDVLAWALYKNGKLPDAEQASEKATQFGTRDALILFHAGMIAEAQGRTDQARNDLKAALEINPHFNLIYADKTQQNLAALEVQYEAKGGSNSHAR